MTIYARVGDLFGWLSLIFSIFALVYFRREYFKHRTSIVEPYAIVGKKTKIWHFSHLMSGCKLGENCNIGQNVVVSPDVVLGKNETRDIDGAQVADWETENNTEASLDVKWGITPDITLNATINPDFSQVDTK